MGFEESGEEELLARPGYAAAIVNALGVAALLLDRTGRVLVCNRGAARILGLDARDACGRGAWEFFAEEEREGAKDWMREEGAAGLRESDWVDAAGERRRVSWSSVAMAEGEVLLTGIDVTRCRRADTALQASEARFRAVIENAGEAILAVDERARITIANPAAARMFGYEREELEGLAVRELIPERWRERHDEAHREYFHNPGERKMGTRRELAGRRKDGSEVALEITLSHMRTEEGTTAIAFLMDVTERMEYRRKLQALARQLLTAQEEERRRMARDLHDDLTQSISLIGMELGFLERQANGPRERFVEGIRGVRRHVDQVVEEVRAISHRLHPTSLEYSGLGPALEGLAAEAEKHGGPAVRVEAGEGMESLSREQATALYQIAHEAVRNAGMHGKATEVSVRIGTTEDGMRMTITDDGEGFQPEQVQPGAGLGLISMEERALSMGGRFAVRSAPGRGTVVVVTLPQVR